MIKIVTKAELLRRDIGDVARQRVEKKQVQARTQQVQRQIQEQARIQAEAIEEAKKEEGFAVGIVEKATKNFPKRFSSVTEFTVGQFGSLEAARRASEEHKKRIQISLRGEQIETKRIKEIKDLPTFNGENKTVETPICSPLIF